MSLYWYFMVDSVAAQNLFIEQLKRTNTAGEVFGAIYDPRERMSLRPNMPIKLP